MDAGQLAILGATFVVFGLVSRRVARSHLTMPMVLVASGWLTAQLDVVDLDLELEGIVLLGEVTLALILFSDAVRMNKVALRSDFGLPVRLLLIGLPLTIVLTGGIISLLLPGLPVFEAALVAAVLAPTDAALGQAVVEDTSVPLRIRQALNVESGLNDGLALPAVLLFVALAEGEESSPGFWGRFMIEQIGFGALVGFALAAAAGWAMHRAREGGWVEGIYAQLATLAVAFTVYATASAVGGNGFIACFVAGLTYGSVMPAHVADRINEYTEDTGRLLAMLAFFVFGNILIHEYIADVTLSVVAASLATLTVGRMIPVFIATLDLRPSMQTVLFLGWFGPRGLASILFGLLLLEDQLEGARDLFGVIAWTVLGSVVLHGATASWGAARYGRWFASHSDEEREDMPEAVEVDPQRLRWER